MDIIHNFTSAFLVSMDWDLLEMFTPPPIKGVTINTVHLNATFRTIIYIIVAFVMIAATVIFIFQKKSGGAAVRKAAIIAFFTAGFVYAIHADIGWYAWLDKDWQEFSGTGTNEKLLRMNGQLYSFCNTAKDVISDSYSIYSTNDYLLKRTEYFLLPLRKRAVADYIIVIADETAQFDQFSHTFIRGDVRISPVEPVEIFAQNAYILKRKP